MMRNQLLFAMVLVGVGVPSLGRAEPGGDGVALRSFEEGRRLFEARSYPDALRAFRASLEAMPSPNTRLYIARCLRETGKVASAYAAFRVASREAEDRVRATGDKRYTATQKSAALEADRLQSVVPRVTLRLDPAPGTRAEDVAAASFALDGAPISRGVLAEPMELDPGSHTVTVAGPHVKSTQTPFTVAPQDNKTIGIRVERTPFGTIRIVLKTKPAGVAVELDGDPLELRSASETRDVPVGPHRVAARAPGYSAFAWEAAIADNANVEVPVDFVPAPLDSSSAPPASTPAGTPKWLFFATAGGAVAALGAGTFLVTDARGRDQEEQAKPVVDRDPEKRNDVRTRAQLGSALLAGGGVLAIAAGVLGVTTHWRSSSTKAAVTLTPRASSDQIFIVGAF